MSGFDVPAWLHFDFGPDTLIKTYRIVAPHATAYDGVKLGNPHSPWRRKFVRHAERHGKVVSQARMQWSMDGQYWAEVGGPTRKKRRRRR